MLKVPGDLIKSIGEVGLEWLAECSDSAGKQFLPSVIPFFTAGDNGRPAPLGTGFLLEIDGARFLVTAAHVMDASSESSIYIGVDDQIDLLEATFQVTEKPAGNRGKDYFDFAFSELSIDQCAKLTSKIFIKENMVSRNRAQSEKRFYTVLGFPASRQDVKWGEARHVAARAWTFTGSPKARKDVASRLGVSGNEHFFIPYEKSVKDFAGKKQNAISPHGASGGILIDLGSANPDRLRIDARCAGLLAGVLIEYHDDLKCIVAVKIQVVLNEIRKYLNSR